MTQRAPSKEELLERAAARVADDEAFVAYALRDWSGERLDLGAVMSFVGCTRAAVVQVALCRRPLPTSASFAAEVQEIANHAGVDSGRLLELLRQAASIRAFRGSAGAQLLAACKHADWLTVALIGCEEVRWCTECGALRWPSGTWQLPGCAGPIDRNELGEMLGHVFRGAFPNAAANVEKFITEATEGSETLQWKPAGEHPGHLNVVLFLLSAAAAPAGERVHIGFRRNKGNWRAFGDESDPDYPPDAVTHYAEMPAGPIEEKP